MCGLVLSVAHPSAHCSLLVTRCTLHVARCTRLKRCSLLPQRRWRAIGNNGRRRRGQATGNGGIAWLQRPLFVDTARPSLSAADSALPSPFVMPAQTSKQAGGKAEHWNEATAVPICKWKRLWSATTLYSLEEDQSRTASCWPSRSCRRRRWASGSFGQPPALRCTSTSAWASSFSSPVVFILCCPRPRPLHLFPHLSKPVSSSSRLSRPLSSLLSTVCSASSSPRLSSPFESVRCLPDSRYLDCAEHLSCPARLTGRRSFHVPLHRDTQPASQLALLHCALRLSALSPRAAEPRLDKLPKRRAARSPSRRLPSCFSPQQRTLVWPHSAPALLPPPSAPAAPAPPHVSRSPRLLDSTFRNPLLCLGSLSLRSRSPHSFTPFQPN